MLLAICFVALVLVLIIYIYGTSNQNYWKNRGVPYIKPLPFIGNILPILTVQQSISMFIADVYTKLNEPYFGIFMFGTPVLIIKCPDLTKSILQKDFDYFCDRTLFSDSKVNKLCASLLFLEKNPSWKTSRKSLTPVFTSNKIKMMLPSFLKYSHEMIQHLETTAKENSNIEIKEVASKYMTDLIVSTIFGIEANCFAEKESEFRVIGRQMFAADLENSFRQLSYFLFHGLVRTFRFSLMKPKVSGFFSDVFTKIINDRIETRVERLDLIHMLIDIRKKLEENGEDGNIKVLAHATQLFLAGFETSAATLSFLLYELCLHGNIQEKARAEIFYNIKQHGGLTFEAVKDMTYLHQCILETLRKYPVLPFLDRTCVRDYVIPDGSGHVIQRGTPVYIPMFGLHYDAKYFSEPELYNPDRFSPTCEEQLKRHPFSYLPFGQGPHVCLGERYGLLAIKAGAISILTKFLLQKNKNTPVPITFSKISFALQSDIGLPMDFHKLE